MGDLTVDQILKFLTIIVTIITAMEFIAFRFKKLIPATMKDTLQPIYDKVGKIEKATERLDKKIDANEADRIRAEMFNYGSIARNKHYISESDWFHIQQIYHKYRDELHQNGEIVHEFQVIAECYDEQFKGDKNDKNNEHK